MFFTGIKPPYTLLSKATWVHCTLEVTWYFTFADIPNHSFTRKKIPLAITWIGKRNTETFYRLCNQTSKHFSFQVHFRFSPLCLNAEVSVLEPKEWSSCAQRRATWTWFPFHHFRFHPGTRLHVFEHICPPCRMHGCCPRRSVEHTGRNCL